MRFCHQLLRWRAPFKGDEILVFVRTKGLKLPRISTSLSPKCSLQMKGYSGCFWKLNDELMIIGWRKRVISRWFYQNLKAAGFSWINGCFNKNDCRGKTCSPLCLVCSPMGTPWQRRWVSDDNGRQFINNAVNRTIFNLPLEVTPNCNIWEEFWGQFCDIFWLFEIYPQYLRGMINSVIYFHKVSWDIFMKFKRKTNWDQLIDISNA